MASSFISFDNQIGFWINDSLFEITCAYIKNALEEYDKDELWLKEMKGLIYENSIGLYPSYMHLGLSEFMTSSERKIIFLEILELTEQHLRKKGEEISVDELNSFIVDQSLQSKWTEPLEARLILRAIEFVQLLIQGRLNILVSDPVDYW